MDYRKCENRLCLIAWKNGKHSIGVITSSFTFVENPKNILDFFKTDDWLAFEKIHGVDIDKNELDKIYIIDTNHPKKYLEV